MNMSFFARKPYVVRRGNYMRHGASLINGKQIAEYLGAKYNPESGYENDLCIYVKPRSSKFIMARNAYVQIVDGHGVMDWLGKLPHIPVIVCSQENYEYLRDRMKVPNKVILIPQHHCNYDREVRTRKEITTIGCIGVASGSFMHPIEDFTKKMKDVGLEFLFYSNFKNREDVVGFYKKIDIQVGWRSHRFLMKNPLKVVNACSFGIPTISCKEQAYKEVEGYYVAVESIDEMIDKIIELKNNPKMYEDYAKRAVEKAEEYHIDNIAKMYKQLYEQHVWQN